ncbi:hypothetical protein FNV43_RR04556 [Rhamnella rubrinervis]|uniref:Uncharacterized protein n=1 Tax=Rhamnella rubrinervis TaxID=2594499 RepID=A0A8K0HM61_9ROSA|nr:hypothetical protein FNV43_RR04556 [Rhamnella rubrinervis]
MTGQLDECASSSLKLAYSILDVVEKNIKLNVEVDNTNKAFNDSLDTNKKFEAKYQKAKQDKGTAEAHEKDCLTTLNRSEKQLQIVQKEKASLIADHEKQAQELEKKLEVAEKEVREFRSDYKNQLVIEFEIMKATLKTVEPNFVLE